MSKGKIIGSGFTVLLLFTPPAHAHWWSNVCSRLIANDPAPYAEEPTSLLLEFYAFERNPEIERELNYRYTQALMSPHETRVFERLGGPHVQR